LGVDQRRSRASRRPAVAVKSLAHRAIGYDRAMVVGRSLLGVLLVTVLVSSRGELHHQSAAVTPLRDALQAKFAELHKAGTFPGGTAGFALADGSTFGLAVGVSNRATGAAMRPTDRLLLGSVGKTYVSAVTLQLVHEGKIALDDPISKYLDTTPWFSRLPNASSITVRQLMQHTSGLVRYELNPKFTADLTANPDKVWSVEDRLAYLFDTKAPFAPGAGWEYSDTNYIVLGAIIERAGGAPYYDQLRKRILEPRGLKDTVPADSRRVPGLVQGYAGPNNAFGGTDEMIRDGLFAVNPQFEWTGGGLAVTAEDLARWAQQLYEGKVVDASLMDDLLAGVPARLGPETSYGLGVIIRPTSLGVSYGHSGFMPGYQTDVMYFPRLRTAVAVQVNSSAPKSTGRALRALVTDLAGVLAGAQP
jgi:D-alanyl-D-alanine carboxypeptidase